MSFFSSRLVLSHHRYPFGSDDALCDVRIQWSLNIPWLPRIETRWENDKPISEPNKFNLWLWPERTAMPNFKWMDGVAHKFAWRSVSQVYTIPISRSWFHCCIFILAAVACPSLSWFLYNLYRVPPWLWPMDSGYALKPLRFNESIHSNRSSPCLCLQLHLYRI